MDTSQLKELLGVALEAARKASKEILEVYHSKDFQVESKGDNSPLTLADKKAHQAIVSILKSTGYSVLSEEGKDIPYAQRKNWKYFWMVDPLDGTKEFIKRNGEFTVNIALIENQIPVLGVVTVPATGEEFYGGRGVGTFYNCKEGEVQLVGQSRKSRNQKGLQVVASRSHMSEETQSFIAELNEPVLISSGSSLKFMLLALDKADIYPRFAPTMEWDTAAAHAIVRTLGISVYEKGTNRELIYNKPDLLNPHFICL